MDMGPRSDGRLVVSLVVLALLAVLAWRTLEPGKLQQVTWLLLGFFALRIVLAKFRTRYSSGESVAEIDYATAEVAERKELLKSKGES